MISRVLIAGVIGATFACSVGLTFAMRRIALSRGLLDVPNARSSHQLPTPRGGGVAIVIASLLGWAAIFVAGFLKTDVFLALSGGGLAVAIVGLLDDRFQLPAQVRLIVHAGAALWALACLGGLPPLQFGDVSVSLGWAGYVLGTLAIIWVLNLFNFMDGIDGIAASQGIFVAAGGGILALATGGGAGSAGSALVFGAACAGFLLWNWPPAKIFMGDVGSGYVGYVVAVLALSAARESPPALAAWFLLGGAFFVDATVTLLRRLYRRDPVLTAHRTHAYQWLARRWGSHLRVTLAFWLVNVGWLLPWAWAVLAGKAGAAWVLLAALLPLCLVAVLAGAGEPEARERG